MDTNEKVKPAVELLQNPEALELLRRGQERLRALEVERERIERERREQEQREIENTWALIKDCVSLRVPDYLHEYLVFDYEHYGDVRKWIEITVYLRAPGCASIVMGVFRTREDGEIQYFNGKDFWVATVKVGVDSSVTPELDFRHGIQATELELALAYAREQQVRYETALAAHRAWTEAYEAHVERAERVNVSWVEKVLAWSRIQVSRYHVES